MNQDEQIAKLIAIRWIRWVNLLISEGSTGIEVDEKLEDDLTSALRAARLEGARQALAWSANIGIQLGSSTVDHSRGVSDGWIAYREKISHADPAKIIKEKP